MQTLSIEVISNVGILGRRGTQPISTMHPVEAKPYQRYSTMDSRCSACVRSMRRWRVESRYPGRSRGRFVSILLVFDVGDELEVAAAHTDTRREDEIVMMSSLS